MKISRIEFENFRNFKERCRIDFPTDGTVTVIYGPNGVGKTTLHQLFQWVFYGEVHFNKTASNKMYNLQYEQELSFAERFSVMGAIDFEHPNAEGIIEYYSLRREWEYRKELTESKKIKEVVHIHKKIGDDWKRLPGEPAEFIEQYLPSGLAQYFFFDGESMIADLNQKGRDSAKSLRRALYSIFDLDVYEQAIAHIGNKGTSSSVLGRLFLSKSENSSNGDLITARGQLRQTQKKIEDLEDTVKRSNNEIVSCRERVQELSELIGSTPSRAALEKQRADIRKTIKTLEEAATKEVKAFGKDVVSHYPYLFLSRIVQEAQYRIGLHIEDEKLIPGLTKPLILSLLHEDKCICGHCIGDEELLSFNEWLKKFPPLSYKYVYDQFKNSASRWSATYNDQLLLGHLESIFKYRDEVEKFRKQIRDIDEELQNGTNVDQYIQERANAEQSILFWEKKKNQANQDLGVQNQYLKQRLKKYDSLVASNETNKVVESQIEIMEEVSRYFEKKLQISSNLYSSTLGASIQTLLNQMLTSARTVEMSPKFELSVRDSYGDEAKSEGQFAVVSFAYIGGIFKLLSEVPELKGKEFPLILDGPFSKLDVVQRQNVINTIPAYAPQIILFSKDDLTACFDDAMKDCVWTIYSNDERNVSYVQKGYDQEVFVLNENKIDD